MKKLIVALALVALFLNGCGPALSRTNCYLQFGNVTFVPIAASTAECGGGSMIVGVRVDSGSVQSLTCAPVEIICPLPPAAASN